MSDDVDYITRRESKVLKTPARRGYSKAAAAEYVGVCPNTLLDLTAAGQLHPKDLRGRRVWMKEDLDRFLDSLKPWHGEPRHSP